MQITFSSGPVFAILAAFCWGAATVMSKSVLGSFSPVFLLVVQLVVSVACLWGFIFVRRIPMPRLAFGEVVAGGLFVALGVVSFAHGGGDSFVGETLIFAGTMAAALYVVLSARFARRIHPLYIVSWQQTVGLGLALLLLPIEWTLVPATQALATIPAGVWLLAALSGIVQYALAFSLYIAALRTISTNYAGSFLSLIPLFGLAGAFLFLHETLSLLQLGGAAVTVFAVTVINLRNQSAI